MFYILDYFFVWPSWIYHTFTLPSLMNTFFKGGFMGDCCTVTWCCGLDFIQTYKEVKESAVVLGPIMLIIINTRGLFLDLGPKDKCKQWYARSTVLCSFSQSPSSIIIVVIVRLTPRRVFCAGTRELCKLKKEKTETKDKTDIKYTSIIDWVD